MPLPGISQHRPGTYPGLGTALLPTLWRSKAAVICRCQKCGAGCTMNPSPGSPMEQSAQGPCHSCESPCALLQHPAPLPQHPTSLLPLNHPLPPLCGQPGPQWCDDACSPTSISPLGVMTPLYEPKRVHLSPRPRSSTQAAPWLWVGPGSCLCHPTLPLCPSLKLEREAGGHSPLEATSPATLVVSAEDSCPGTHRGTVLSPGRRRA